MRSMLDTRVDDASNAGIETRLGCLKHLQPEDLYNPRTSKAKPQPLNPNPLLPQNPKALPPVPHRRLIQPELQRTRKHNPNPNCSLKPYAYTPSPELNSALNRKP